jgi:hypothetical protein
MVPTLVFTSLETGRMHNQSVSAVLISSTQEPLKRKVIWAELRRMKLAVLGSDDHGEDPWPTCQKVSILLLATARFIGSKSILVCDGFS